MVLNEYLPTCSWCVIKEKAVIGRYKVRLLVESRDFHRHNDFLVWITKFMYLSVP
ncbi:MAG: hypothetical protein ACTJLM_02450 [Ehrlichia sp.]